MAASLSEDDFQCLQNQLLELKTRSYVLEEKNSKYGLEINRLNCNLTYFKDEYAKAQKIIQRSKTAHELQLVVKENERLQSKLQSQEDEFRLQNETLMQEVLSLTSANQKLEKDIELSKAEDCLSSEKENSDEILRLQAENNALKKLVNKSTNVDPIKDAVLLSELKEATETEEKFILKEKLLKLQKRHKEEILHLQSENEKLNEKLKRKQESMLQLHDEKEKMYSEHQKSVESLQAEKEAVIKSLKEEVQSLQSQVLLLTTECRECNNKLLNSVHDGNTYGDPEATVQFMSGEKAAFECSLNETKMYIREYEGKLHDLSNKLEEAEMLIKKLCGEKDILEQSKTALEKEKADLLSVLAEQSNLAEKRKVHMDEMNNHILETTNKHSKEIENLTQQLMQEQEALQNLFDKEKETRLELVQSQNEVQSIRKELEHIKKEHAVTQKELKVADETHEEIKLSFEKQFKQQEQQHQTAVKLLEDKLKMQFQDFNIQIEVAQAEKTEFEEKVVALQQEVKDLIDEKKIIEKKNSSLAKDLKRQLVTERKRAEKLQERLQEVLNEQNRPIDEILQTSSGDKHKGDASSVSSWSYVSADAADRESRENPSHSDGSSCGRDSPSCTSPLENETSNLLAKITHLQQRNWILEEKVNHLEMSNEALVDDLLKKTAIIQYYCMEGRSNTHTAGAQDKLTIKRIVDFIKDKGDENLREMNRKMQRMLEETLTKNMHLQKDIETLSNEVTRLSKAKEKVDPDLQSTVFIDGV